jgi:hypothetical protein
MSQVKIRCPYCKGETTADDTKATAFCMNCGGKIDMAAALAEASKSQVEASTASSEPISQPSPAESSERVGEQQFAFFASSIQEQQTMNWRNAFEEEDDSIPIIPYEDEMVIPIEQEGQDKDAEDEAEAFVQKYEKLAASDASNSDNGKIDEYKTPGDIWYERAMKKQLDYFAKHPEKLEELGKASAKTQEPLSPEEQEAKRKAKEANKALLMKILAIGLAFYLSLIVIFAILFSSLIKSSSYYDEAITYSVLLTVDGAVCLIPSIILNIVADKRR